MFDSKHKIEGKQQIFSNCFTLTFIKKSIEEEYKKDQQGKLIPMLIYMIVMTVFLTVGLLLMFIIKDRIFPTDVEYQAYAIIILLVSTYLFYGLRYLNQRFAIYQLYLNFLTLTLILNFFTNYMTKAVVNPRVVFFTMTCEYVLKISYILLIDENFLRIFIINTLLSMVYMIYGLSVSLYAEYLSIFFGYCIFSGFCYLLCRFLKGSFYFKEELLAQRQWFYEILNNLKNGVMIWNVNSMGFEFINNHLKSFKEFGKKSLNKSKSFFSSNDIQQVQLLSNEDSIQMGEVELIENSYETNNVFSKITKINKDLPAEIRDLIHNSKKMHLDEVIQGIINYYSENYKGSDCTDDSSLLFKNFIFLGIITLTSSNNSFELYIKGIKYLENDYIEFMFNDISKDTEYEQQRLQEKTLILGKLSHEFKNPLIIICESIEQINDQNFQNKEESKQKLKFILHMCYYLISFIKDFELMSSVDNNLDIVLKKEEVKMTHFLSVIKNIAETLIDKKTNKSNAIKFVLNREKKVKNLLGDDIRLRQILINLLSNAIKFTDSGSIELKVERVEKQAIVCTEENHGISSRDISKLEIKLNDHQSVYAPSVLQESVMDKKEYLIRFSVIDTGIGISEVKLLKALNGEYDKVKSMDNNMYTGYGLGIVKNLCELMGSDIKFKINKPQGCIFSFEIPYIPTKFEKPKEQPVVKKDKSDTPQVVTQRKNSKLYEYEYAKEDFGIMGIEEGSENSEDNSSFSDYYYHNNSNCQPNIQFEEPNKTCDDENELGLSQYNDDKIIHGFSPMRSHKRSDKIDSLNTTNTIGGTLVMNFFDECSDKLIYDKKGKIRHLSLREKLTFDKKDLSSNLNSSVYVKKVINSCKEKLPYVKLASNYREEERKYSTSSVYLKDKENKKKVGVETVNAGTGELEAVFAGRDKNRDDTLKQKFSAVLSEEVRKKLMEEDNLNIFKQRIKNHNLEKNSYSMKEAEGLLPKLNKFPKSTLSK